MSKESTIKEHQEKLEVLREKVRARKQEVLDNIDLDKLMENPNDYLDWLS